MNGREIKRLRRKFILIALASFLSVILFIGLLINGINHFITQREIIWSVNQIIERQEQFDEYDERREIRETPSLFEVFSPSGQIKSYYILKYDSTGNETSYFASKGSTYTESEIRENASQIMSHKLKKGIEGLCYFKKFKGENGGTTLVILDITNIMYFRMRLFYATGAVGLFGIIAALILVVIFSKKMIEPEIENSKRQSQFLTNVSHELKTPLAIIRSNAEMQELTEGESDWTKSTICQVDRMNGLIKNLVMITKSSEANTKAFDIIINASKIIKETAGEFYPVAESEGKKITEDICENLNIVMDESKLRQLTTILLDNAVKYCDDGGNIDISLKPFKHKKKSIQLTVSNAFKNGEKADTRLFFDRFYREDKSHNIDTGGYGIGLNIAESICEQYGGNIYAEWQNGFMNFICEL